MNDALQLILDSGVIAIIRSDSPAGLADTARALADGGIRAIEVTMTTPGALEAISAVATRGDGQILIGAGSVLDAESARMAILNGAEFLVAPNVDPASIQMAKRYGKPICPGAFTATEIVLAWQAGADIVKIFPASSLGPGYISAIRGPLPQVRLMPVGGVNVDNLGAYIKAGACAVALGGNLVSKTLIAEGDWARITEMARQCVDAVSQARA